MGNDTENNRIIEELYIDMYTMLLIYARNALGDIHLAEEAVQDTFRIACAKSEQLIESKNRQGWLTNTLKHVICNTRRSQERFSSLLKIITASAQMSSEACVDNVELIRHVVIEKRTMAEASRECEVSVENCKKRIQRAKKKLKAAIVEDFL